MDNGSGRKCTGTRREFLWEMGAGFGGPAVSGGHVFWLDRDETVGDTLRVFDLASG